MSVKKQKGAGSIVKTKSGKYRAMLRYTDQYGNYQRLQATEPTEAKAQKKLEEFRRKLKQIKKAQTQNVAIYSVERYMKEIFLPYKMQTLRKPQSYRRLESTIESHIIPNHGYKILNQVNANDINELIETLRNKGFSHSSIKKVYDAYGNMFKYAIDIRRDIDPYDNPMTAVIMPSIKDFSVKEIKNMAADEVKLFAEEASRHFKTGKPVYRYGAVFLFMLNTGLREGEFCALRQEDIDFEQRVIKITRSVYMEVIKDDKGVNRYQLKVGEPKTRNSIRYVPMSDEAIKYAKQLLLEFNHEYLLISNSNGGMVRPDTLSKQFNRILENANLPKRGIHTLRHTFVSVLFESGVDTHTIAEIIGDNESTVKKTYLHLYKSRKAKAVKGVNVVAMSEKMMYNEDEHDEMQYDV